jgi:proteasome lid subunit RPN8/RPN11
VDAEHVSWAAPREPPSPLTDVPGLNAVLARVVHPHVFANADREVGGILVGRLPEGAGPPQVIGAIPADSAEERSASLTFTHRTWEHFYAVLGREYPPATAIVGWYHSHPGFGIFLSEHDLFIHRHFFSGHAQIAHVVDPLHRTEGVFVWRGDEIVQVMSRQGIGPPNEVVEDRDGEAGATPPVEPQPAPAEPDAHEEPAASRRASERDTARNVASVVAIAVAVEALRRALRSRRRRP